MAHMGSCPSLLFLLLLPYSFRSAQIRSGDEQLISGSPEDLEKYREYLRRELYLVDNAISSTRTKRNARPSPHSPSLPDKDSAYFLNRIGALKQHLKLSLNDTSESVDQHQPRIDFNSQVPVAEALQACKKLSQPELVAELKQKGTYNPDLMAWDALGVIRFLDRTIHDHYQREVPSKSRQRAEEVVERNVEALARLLKELNVSCNVTTPAIRARLHNITLMAPRHSAISPSLRRTKRLDSMEQMMGRLNTSTTSSEKPSSSKTDEDHSSSETKSNSKNKEESINGRQKLVGESHVVPFGCDKRGAEEDGYLRLCGACQAIRRLPDTFFPPFINEVTCDSDKACLYFYEYPHGKCRQKHMNFVVLRNVGTNECQVWRKFNLNVRVSCECFVDEMSFFSKYV